MNSLKNHLLISAPHMHDNIFKNTVIYICEHNLEGAMGLIINKPMDSVSINDQKFMNNMSNSKFDNLKMKLYFGGPILLEKFIALHTNELKTETAIPLNNKISISQQLSTIVRIPHSSGAPTAKLRSRPRNPSAEPFNIIQSALRFKFSKRFYVGTYLF